MSVSKVDGDSGSYGFSATATWGNAPTEGNLLVAATSHRDIQSVASMTSTGWTLIFQDDVEPSSGTYRRALAVFAKIAGASESTTVDPSWTNGVSHTIIVAEFELSDGTWDAVTTNVNASGDNAQNSNQTSVGTTNTSSTSNQLACLFGVWKDNNSTGTITHSCSGYTLAEQYTTGAWELDTSILWKEFSDTAVRGETITIDASGTDANTGLIGGIAVFGYTSTGGGAAPRMTLLGAG